jgi:regulation of enolase protein 1 (concanavalin A-like superfamily)
MLSCRKAAVIGGIIGVCALTNFVRAQTGPRLAWDGQVSPAVSGYAVTIDGVRTNHGLTPIVNGTCGCSIPVPFSGGRHTIVVIAYNSVGEASSAPFVVGPAANPGGPYTGTTGAAVAVSGAGSVAPTGSLTNYTWRWGDGTTDTSSALASASHTYATSGTFTITLTVRDNAGATASATTTAVVSSSPTPPPSNPPPTTLPTPWITQDIGNVGLSGSATFSSGRFTVAGAGADIWGTADAFRFVYQPLDGDGQIVARVTSMQNTNVSAKAGVMIRQSLTSGSAHALVNLRPSGGIEFLTRSSSSGATVLSGSTSQAPPTWLKLVRTGNSIVASVSANGSTWSVVGTVSISMPSTVQIGLAVTSHTTAQLNSSIFDNVAVTTAGGPPPQPLSAPAVPGSPTPSNGQTGIAVTSNLTWSSIGATSYDVSFGTTNPPPQVATNLTAASYAPPSMVANSQYFWRVVARNGGGTTTGPVWSFTTAPQPTPPSTTLPTPWITQDVGNVGLSGSASYSSGRFTVTAAGADIWETADSFRFVYQPLSGDGQIVARVTSLTNTHAYAKAGVMIRESLSPGAPHALVGFRPAGVVELVTRSSAGASTANRGSTNQGLPAWVKLARSGNSIVASVSANGSSWSVVGTTNVTMASNALVGLAVMSHNTSALATAALDNVTVTTGSSTQPPATPGSPTPSNGATGVTVSSGLTWSALGATSYDVRFGTANPPPQVATGVTAPTYSPGTLSGNTRYNWQIVARNSAGTTAGPVWSFTTVPQSTGGAVPQPWANQDVGDVGLTGNTSFSSGTFSVSGSGRDTSGRTDSFQYVFQPLTGDGQIVARVTNLENTDANAAAAIMVRASLTDDSQHATLGVNPAGGIQFVRRANAGGQASNVASGSQSTPAWLKLVRTGSTITGHVSSNGSAWTQIGSTTVTLGSTPSIGLVVTSQDNSELSTATFDSVNVTVGGSAPPPPTSSGNVVIYASDIPAAARHGSWQAGSDSLSPNQAKLRTADSGWSNVSAPLAAPTHYVDVSFNADANKPYRLWLRLQAAGNSGVNDSLWVQFSDALVSGSPMFRTNTTSGLLINLDPGTGAALNGWGWQNAANWLSQPTTFTFPTSGMHTIRIQVREDGVEFDQIVLSPSTYLNTAPGPAIGDSTIVPKQ